MRRSTCRSAAQAPWWIEADWRGLDAASAFRLAEVRVLPFGAALDGHRANRSRAGRAVPPRGAQHVDAARSRRARRRSTVRSSSSSTEGAGAPTSVTGSAPLASSGRIGGVWNRQAASRSTFEGDLTLATTDIGETARYAALFGLTSPAIVNNTTGPLDATAKIGGIFIEPRFVGSARTAPAPTCRRLARRGFTADFDVSPRPRHASPTSTAAITPASGAGAGGARRTCAAT